jgi:hypothetical protein
MSAKFNRHLQVLDLVRQLATEPPNMFLSQWSDSSSMRVPAGAVVVSIMKAFVFCSPSIRARFAGFDNVSL